ncbi:MAG: acyltransferase [Armatimonadetes bacterium]|nr:MAG: acyltransferase [Armatimonadota bacterium]
MSETLRAALVQAAWTGDYDSMLLANTEYAHQAANQGAKVLCFQEIFTGPYFCTVQDPKFYDLAEEIPNGRTVTAMKKVAAETGMVMVVPIYEKVDEGTFYNTAAVIDAGGEMLGIYRKTHIPQVEGFWEKFYFRPGNLGYPVFDTAVGRIGVYICYDRHFPEGWRELGLKGAKLVFNPSATTRGHSKYLWELEQPAAAVANQYFVGAINRVGSEDLEDTDYYGSSYFVDPRGQIVGGTASDTSDEVVVRDLDMSEIEAARRHWAFYRDRRPEVYEGIARW